MGFGGAVRSGIGGRGQGTVHSHARTKRKRSKKKLPAAPQMGFGGAVRSGIGGRGQGTVPPGLFGALRDYRVFYCSETQHYTGWPE
jgi:hypothetical protein